MKVTAPRIKLAYNNVKPKETKGSGIPGILDFVGGAAVASAVQEEAAPAAEVEASKNVSHTEAFNSAGDFYEPKAGTLSNVEARKWYLQQESKIPSMIDKSLPLEQQARQAFDLRNKFRAQARDFMVDRVAAESLKLTDPNLSWTEVVAKAEAKGYSGDEIYKYIIDSATRSRKSVNKALGFE